MLRRVRHRAHLGLVLIACLLFQQVAVAAYACRTTAMQAPVQVTHCAERNMAPAVAPVSPLCDKHCTPDLSLLTDTTAPGVPALAQPPAFSLVLHQPSAPVHRNAEPIARLDPPPRLRYCSLLI